MSTCLLTRPSFWRRSSSLASVNFDTLCKRPAPDHGHIALGMRIAQSLSPALPLFEIWMKATLTLKHVAFQWPLEVNRSVFGISRPRHKRRLLLVLVMIQNCSARLFWAFIGHLFPRHLSSAARANTLFLLPQDMACRKATL